MKRTCFIAIALMAAGAGLPAAQAEASRETFAATFSIDRSAPANTVYAAVLRQARRACESGGRSALHMAAANRACANDLVDQVIARSGRTDVAILHMDRTGRGLPAPRDLASLDR